MFSPRNLHRFAGGITPARAIRGGNAKPKENVMTEPTETADGEQVPPAQKAETKAESGEVSTVAQEIRGTLKSLHGETKSNRERIEALESRLKKMGW